MADKAFGLFTFIFLSVTPHFLSFNSDSSSLPTVDLSAIIMWTFLLFAMTYTPQIAFFQFRSQLSILAPPPLPLLGIKPRTLSMLDQLSTPELQTYYSCFLITETFLVLFSTPEMDSPVFVHSILFFWLWAHLVFISVSSVALLGHWTVVASTGIRTYTFNSPLYMQNLREDWVQKEPE